MTIINKYLVPRGYAAITIFPFIIFKDMSKATQVRLNHENIHLRQQLELLIILFYIWYAFDFLIQYLKYGDVKTAYMNIIFEKEAYKNEKKLNYLKKRKLFAFIRK
jgi:uncharacterized membrane protein